MGVERFSLDTNVLFYSIDPADRERHSQAKALIERAVLEVDCVVTLQSFSEFYAATTRKGAMPPEDAREQIADWQLLFPTLYPSPGCLERAIRAVLEHNLSFWDSMLWSVAKEGGVTVLLTEDLQDGRELEGVVFRNPFNGLDPLR